MSDSEVTKLTDGSYHSTKSLRNVSPINGNRYVSREWAVFVTKRYIKENSVRLSGSEMLQVMNWIGED